MSSCVACLQVDRSAVVRKKETQLMIMLGFFFVGLTLGSGVVLHKA